MKTPIKADDVREGDLIRAEYPDETRPKSQDCRAVEFVAPRDGYRWTSEAVQYLLDRPTPPVELPTEPTLGWAKHRDGESLGRFGPGPLASSGDVSLDEYDCEGDQVFVRLHEVIAFTPATAVPTAALNALRDDVAGWSMPPDPNSIVGKFLRAVDAANGPTS